MKLKLSKFEMRVFKHSISAKSVLDRTMTWNLNKINSLKKYSILPCRKKCSLYCIFFCCLLRFMERKSIDFITHNLICCWLIYICTFNVTWKCHEARWMQLVSTTRCERMSLVRSWHGYIQFNLWCILLPDFHFLMDWSTGRSL